MAKDVYKSKRNNNVTDICIVEKNRIFKNMGRDSIRVLELGFLFLNCSKVILFFYNVTSL